MVDIIDFEDFVEKVKDKLVMLALVRKVEVRKEDRHITHEARGWYVVYVLVDDLVTFKVMHEINSKLFSIVHYRANLKYTRIRARLILARLELWIGDLLNE